MLGGHAALERGAWVRGHKLPPGQRREEQGLRAAGQSRVLGELAPACPAVCLKLRAMGAVALPSGRCIHCAQPRMLLHTQEAFPHITSFLGNRQQGAKEVLFPFFLTHVQILIYFWCQWWLFLREDGAGFVPSPCSSIYPGHFIPPLCLGSGGRWGASLSHSQALYLPRYLTKDLPPVLPGGYPSAGVTHCVGYSPSPGGLCFPPTSFQSLLGGYQEPVCLLRMDLLWNNSPLWRPRVCPVAAVGGRPVGW